MKQAQRRCLGRRPALRADDAVPDRFSPVGLWRNNFDGTAREAVIGQSSRQRADCFTVSTGPCLRSIEQMRDGGDHARLAADGDA